MRAGLCDTVGVHPGVELREEIGRGVRSIVYATSDGRAVKVPNDDVPVEWIVEELRLADAVGRAGAPVPGDRHLIEVSGRPALASARVDGASMWQLALDDPGACAPLARRLAAIQRDLADLPASFELPSQRDRIVAKVHAAAARHGSELLGAIDLMTPDVGPLVLCHGDLHPRNVLFGAAGEEIVDWFDACRGVLAADVARTLVVFDDTFEVSIDPPAAMAVAVSAFREHYLAAVGAITGATDDLDDWITVQQVARLAEGLGTQRLQALRRRLA